MISGTWVVIAVCVFFLCGILVTYTLSVSTGHVTLLWCFISYTGNFPVESCIFTAVLNICAGIFLLIVILRYCQIFTVIEESELTEKKYKKMKRLNEFSLATGIIGGMGLSITGCFQQRNVHIVHMFGVFCCTGGTSIFIFLETYFTFTVMSERTKRSLKIFRAVVTSLSSIVILIGAGFVVHNFAKNPKHFGTIRAEQAKQADLSDIVKAGTVLEWILFFLIQMYVYSLYPDFRGIGLKRDEIIFLN